MQKKLKVMYFVDNFYPVTGGINTVVDKSSIELSKYIDITVVAVKHKTYKDPEKPYKILRCNGYWNTITGDGMAHPYKDKEFIKEITTGGYDLFHCHTAGNLLGVALKMGKKLNIPVLSTMHNTFYMDVKRFLKFKGLARLVTKIFFKRTNKSDYLWCVSKFCEDFVRPFGITKPVKTMYNAIEFKPPSAQEQSQADVLINQKFNLSNNTFLATFISRIERTKNIDLVIDSALLLKQNYPQISNIKFMVVGGGSYLKHSQKRVEKLGLSDRFIFTDMIRDRQLMSNIYMRTNLLLFPSYMDSAGLIQVEGAAYSKPTLSIENVAQAESIVDKQNGLIAKNDAQDYLDKILFGYNNQNELKQMGENANKTLYRTYSDKRILDEIIDGYKEIIEDYANKKK